MPADWKPTIEHPEIQSFGADYQHHLVRMTWWEYGGSEAPQGHQHDMNPQTAIELGMALITQARVALGTQIRDARLGECSTCGNLRMVDVAKPGGHSMREHCPDCMAKELPPIPTVTGWVEDEKRLLR